MHWITHPGLRDAVARYLKEERRAVGEEMEALAEHSPFRKDDGETLMPYDPNNVFAKIIRGEAPCFKVYEDAHTIAFMDIMPQAEGHTLVIPKEHAELIFDLSPDGAAALIKATKKVAAAVRDVTNAPGIMLAQLNGVAAGQTVFHIHFHIIPRSAASTLNSTPRQMADFEKLKVLGGQNRGGDQIVLQRRQATQGRDSINEIAVRVLAER